MNRKQVLMQTRTAVRVILFSTIGTGFIAGTGFAGIHLYLETRDPTPSNWPQRLRFSYRAAVFNSEYLKQKDAARVELLSLIQKLKEHSSDDVALPRSDLHSPISNPSGKSLASDGLARVLVLLAKIEKEQGDLQAAMEHYREALDCGLRSITAISAAARHLGEIQERFGLHSAAKQAYELALQSVLPQYQTGDPLQFHEPLQHSANVLDAAKSLTLFAARQGHLKESLANLLTILQYERQSPNPTQPCHPASTMSNIAEIVWALGDSKECERWTRESLDLCTTPKNKDNRYCLECAGINHNILGLLSQRSGNLTEAQTQFRQALISAERAGDDAGLQQYVANVEKCQSGP